MIRESNISPAIEALLGTAKSQLEEAKSMRSAQPVDNLSVIARGRTTEVIDKKEVRIPLDETGLTVVSARSNGKNKGGIVFEPRGTVHSFEAGDWPTTFFVHDYPVTVIPDKPPQER